MMQGRGGEGAGQAGFDPGFLKQLLPSLGASIEERRNFNALNNKILHDYAFTLALRAIEEKHLMTKVDDLEREDEDVFPVS